MTHAVKFIPNVEFVLSSLESETNRFCDFLERKNNRWSYVFYKVYPELENLVKESKGQKEFESKISEFVGKTIKNNESDISKARELIQKDWDSIGKQFLTTLSEHFETKWPEDKGTIIGYVSILPVFPRYLDTYSFCVGFRNLKQARETVRMRLCIFCGSKSGRRFFRKLPEKNMKILIWSGD